MRVAVIGYSGSGKSTLAAHLGRLTGAPVLHLDSVHWLPGWKERPRDEERELVRSFLDTHASWVIDGNYGPLFFDERMEKADRIIFLNFNRFVCLYRAMKRAKQYRGQTRPDMGRGCTEKMDFEFARWILLDGRTDRMRMRYRQLQTKYPEKFLEIRNQKALSAFTARAMEAIENHEDFSH